MNFDNALYEILKLSFIDSQASGAGTYTTSWLPMKDDGRALHVINVGAVPDGATLDAKVEKAKDVNGTGAVTLTDFKGTELKIDQLTTTEDGAKCLLEHTDETLRKGFTHVRLSITVAGGTIPFGAVVIRGVTDYPPVDRSGYAQVKVAHPELPYTLDI